MNLSNREAADIVELYLMGHDIPMAEPSEGSRREVRRKLRAKERAAKEHLRSELIRQEEQRTGNPALAWWLLKLGMFLFFNWRTIWDLIFVRYGAKE